MKRLLGLLCVLVLFFGLPQMANALSVGVDDDITDNTYMPPGTTLSGTFDINPEIPANGDYITPYDIDSAYYTFQFTDDGELNYVYTTTSSWSSGNTQYRTYYDYYYDEYEEVRVNMNGEISTDGTNWEQIIMLETIDFQFVNPLPGVWYYIYSYYYDVEQGYTGQITILNPLENTALAALADDGIAEFTLTATSGDIYYDWGTLDAEVNKNAIPDPSMVFLLGSACLIGFAGARKKFKK